MRRFYGVVFGKILSNDEALGTGFDNDELIKVPPIRKLGLIWRGYFNASDMERHSSFESIQS